MMNINELFSKSVDSFLEDPSHTEIVQESTLLRDFMARFDRITEPNDWLNFLAVMVDINDKILSIITYKDLPNLFKIFKGRLSEEGKDFSGLAINDLNLTDSGFVGSEAINRNENIKKIADIFENNKEIFVVAIKDADNKYIGKVSRLKFHDKIKKLIS